MCGVAWAPNDRSERVSDTSEGRGLSDAEARATAEQIVREARQSPQDHDDMAADQPPSRGREADEDRIEQAPVDLGAADPEATTMAERAAGRSSSEIAEIRRPAE